MATTYFVRYVRGPHTTIGLESVDPPCLVRGYDAIEMDEEAYESFLKVLERIGTIDMPGKGQRGYMRIKFVEAFEVEKKDAGDEGDQDSPVEVAPSPPTKTSRKPRKTKVK